MIIAGIIVSPEAAQGAGDLGYMLVGVACANIIDISCQWFVEGGTVEIGRCLEKSCFLFGTAHHLRKTGQRFTCTPIFTGNVHVPHLIAVARCGSAFLLRTVGFHISAVMKSVPYPEAHILGYQQRFGGHCGIIYIGSNLDEPCKLFVDGVVRCPHPAFVVIGAVHLDHCGMMRRDRIEITVPV